MSKLTLNSIGSRYGSVDALNDNFDSIEQAVENTLSRDGTGPNAMEANLDMNGNTILNVGALAVNSLSINGQNVVPSATAITTLPSQTGQNGKLLSTDGTTAFWQVPTSNQVTFIQSGTGAQPRTAQEKMRDALCVFDFMTAAQIDSVRARTFVIDLTVPVQKAIDEAVATGRDLFCPSGGYSVGALTAAGPITIVGEGSGPSVVLGRPVRNGTVWLRRAGTNANFFTALDTAAFELDTNYATSGAGPFPRRDVRFFRISIVGNKANNTAGGGLVAQGSSSQTPNRGSFSLYHCDVQSFNGPCLDTGDFRGKARTLDCSIIDSDVSVLRQGRVLQPISTSTFDGYEAVPGTLGVGNAQIVSTPYGSGFRLLPDGGTAIRRKLNIGSFTGYSVKFIIPDGGQNDMPGRITFASYPDGTPFPDFMYFSPRGDYSTLFKTEQPVLQFPGAESVYDTRIGTKLTANVWHRLDVYYDPVSGVLRADITRLSDNVLTGSISRTASPLNLWQNPAPYLIFRSASTDGGWGATEVTYADLIVRSSSDGSRNVFHSTDFALSGGANPVVLANNTDAMFLDCSIRASGGWAVEIDGVTNGEAEFSFIGGVIENNQRGVASIRGAGLSDGPPIQFIGTIVGNNSLVSANTWSEFFVADKHNVLIKTAHKESGAKHLVEFFVDLYTPPERQSVMFDATFTASSYKTSVTNARGAFVHGAFGSNLVRMGSSLGTTAGFVTGGGTSMHVNSTSTGGTGSVAYTFGDIVRVLKTLGLIQT